MIHDARDYATLFWARHCQLGGDAVWNDAATAQEAKAILHSEPLAGTALFDSWVLGVERLLSEAPFGFYDAGVERELEHSVSTPASPFLVACVFGFPAAGKGILAC